MARRTGLVLILAIGAVLMLALASVGAADHGKGNGKGKGKSKSVEAKLHGYQEVPAISTTGKGKVKLKIRNSTSIDFELRYSGLSSPAAAAHIHFAQWGVNGAVMAHLCGTGGKPACPAGNNGNKVTVAGTLMAADIVETGQGIAPGELTEAIAAIKSGVAYVNVHTATFPNGEIRGQLDRGKKRDD